MMAADERDAATAEEADERRRWCRTRGLGGGLEEMTVAYKGNKGFGVGPPRKVQVTWNGEKKMLSLDESRSSWTIDSKKE